MNTLTGSVPRAMILALFLALAMLAGGFALARAQAHAPAASGVVSDFVDCNALRCGDG